MADWDAPIRPPGTNLWDIWLSAIIGVSQMEAGDAIDVYGGDVYAHGLAWARVTRAGEVRAEVK